MELFDVVYEGYPAAAAKGHVRGNEQLPALVAIKSHLPELLQREIRASTREAASYKCYGKFGELNRSFAHIPWVACCRRHITSSVKDGYFIVLLFRRDMKGCWLSLNQGFTQYQNTFVNSALSLQQCRVGALTLANIAGPAEGFRAGPIDLDATLDLGKGYEQGAILSRYYDADDPNVTEQAFKEDFLRLLDVYDDLSERVGSYVVELLPDAEGPYQAAAAEIAKSDENNPLPQGPLAPPKQTPGNYGTGWRRDPRVAAAAIKTANYLCEVDANHGTFVARRGRRNFVEAHHLIPISRQSEFSYRLDVPENIAALCPTCHRKIHYGLNRDRVEMAKALLAVRAPLLDRRGIGVDVEYIKEVYRSQLDED